MNRYCIAKMRGKILSFLLDEGGHALEIHADGEKECAAVGNIYIGRVQSVSKNIRAAFVEVEHGVICYLPLDDLKDPCYTRKGPCPSIQQGDELVVQISREAIKTKAPALTTRLSMQGVYSVLDMAHPGVGVSKKIREADRERLKKLGQSFLDERADCQQGYAGQSAANEAGAVPGFGVVLRTNAASVPEETVMEELQVLAARLEHIVTAAPYRTCHSCLYRKPAAWLGRLQSLNREATEAIVIEDQDLLAQADAWLEEQCGDHFWKERIRHYQDPLLSMVKLYSLEKELEDALAERVWLRSGAYLVIQPTEALTVVDVNTGKNEKGKEKEETVCRVNLEAARETARQMRLRNLSGIIVIDFINMEQEISRRRVMEELRSCLAADPVQAHVIDFTRLGLVEATRKKVERPLREQLA